jgi:hypothetical protein
MTTSQQIRRTIKMLEAVNDDFEYVKNRDFTHVVDFNGYTLGSFEHDYGDNVKMDYAIYKKVGDKSFEYNGKTYNQEVYNQVQNLDISPYISKAEAVEEFKKVVSSTN